MALHAQGRRTLLSSWIARSLNSHSPVSSNRRAARSAERNVAASRGTRRGRTRSAICCGREVEVPARSCHSMPDRVQKLSAQSGTSQDHGNWLALGSRHRRMRSSADLDEE